MIDSVVDFACLLNRFNLRNSKLNSLLKSHSSSSFSFSFRHTYKVLYSTISEYQWNAGNLIVVNERALGRNYF